MKKLPIGIQTFRDLIEKGYVYVDKTRHIYTFFEQGGKYYFLSRPRRFGKSLLLSTLEEIFSGNKKLFKNLWILDKIEWKKFPILHIDFSNIGYDSGETLKASLSHMLDKIAAKENISLTPGLDYKNKFTDLIESLAKKNQVVILIDEYDKPIIDFIDNKDKARENRDILKNLYSVLKGSDRYIRFAFITGVSKFSRVSIFSGLNNLIDITIDDRFAELLGWSREEILNHFEDRLDSLGKKTGIDKKELLFQLEKWYNGYSWDGSHYLYNPFSILNLLSKNRFGNYWFTSGTPTFLIDHLKNKRKNIISLDREEVDESLFESFDLENLEVLSLLFQTGYLTIKEVKTFGVKSQYLLSYPNAEVKESFLKHFLASCSTDDAGSIGSHIMDLAAAVSQDDFDDFFTVMKVVFASIPSHIFIKDKEAYYHTIIYLILTLLGIHINAEVHTNKGRLDAVIETASHIYLLEFKIGTPDEALKQIEEKKYYERYLSSRKSLTLIGVGFDQDKKNISGYRLKSILPG